MNPAAGGGRGLRVADLVERRLRTAGADVRRIQESRLEAARDRLSAVTTDALTPGSGRVGPAAQEAVVVCGGDGTVHLALQALAGSSVTLGIVPAGTGNDLARALGLPTDPERAADVVLAGRTRSMDLARVRAAEGGAEQAVYAATVVATGLDADIAARAGRPASSRHARGTLDIAARMPGALRYPLATLTELPRMRPRSYRLVLDGQATTVEALLVAVANGPSYGGGLRIAPDARLDDGLLDVVVVAPVSRRRLAWEFRRLRDGTILEISQVTRHRVREVRIDTNGEPHADGESLRLGPNVVVEAVPAALEVIA